MKPIKGKPTIAYAIKWEMNIDTLPKEKGYVKCDHITEKVIICPNLNDSTFYSTEDCAVTFKKKFDDYYQNSIKFEIVKVEIKEITE